MECPNELSTKPAMVIEINCLEIQPFRSNDGEVIFILVALKCGSDIIFC